MSFSLRIFIFGLFLWLIDLYFYQAVSLVFRGSSETKRSIVFYTYWSFTLFSFLIFLTTLFVHISLWPKFIRVYVFAFVVMALISKLIGTVFIALDDIIRLCRWVGSYLIRTFTATVTNEEGTDPNSISRLKFLNYIALGMAAIPFATLIYGMFKGAFDFRVRKERVVLSNLPDAFNGLKIVQISDIHSGSFISTKPLEEAVKIVMAQNADVIFFTGDLVNDRATEVEPFMDILSRIKAPMGVFSTFGNHDYGDYTTWESREAKEKNLHDLKMIHAQLGWKLMLNEYVALKKNDSEIGLIGVENWGGNLHFTKYGDMKKASHGTEKYPVRLLLSHDPSHWNTQVIKEYKNIDLTFSGHTHGFQFGIEIPGFKWSPSQYVYKQWAGMYSEGNQYLYVNRGLGFLGYPGRVGIMPEITVVELYNS